MGIKFGIELLYSLKLTNLFDLRLVLRHRNDDSDRGPTVAFDANWLYYENSGRKGTDAPYVAIGDLAFIFAANNINVVVVADGPTRHDSKKASLDRRADKGLAQTVHAAHKAELMTLVDKSGDKGTQNSPQYAGCRKSR
jgi:hypothetical protein